MRPMLILATVLGLLLLAGSVYAQTGGGYDLTWHTIDGGGATFSTSADYTLGGTTGQPDAGTLSAGSYTLRGGFWAGVGQHRIYLPLVLHTYE